MKTTKPKRPKTRLWACSMKPEGGGIVIEVREGPVKMGPSHHTASPYGAGRLIRACTAKAAGRRLRKNIPSELASLDRETDNRQSPTYYDLPPEYVKRYAKHAKLAEVRVIKQEQPHD